MDLLRRFFPQKSVPTGLFSFAFPQAPASLQNPKFLAAYRGWVYACVKRKADATATMELTLQEKQGDEWKESQNEVGKKALNVLTTVNPFATSDGLYRGTSSFLDLVGNSFWCVVYNRKAQAEPTELWQLDPTKVSVIRDDRNYIRGWKYINPKGKEIFFSPQEIVPFQEFNPLDAFRGLGPTEAGALTIDTEQYRATYKRNFFSNSAVPSLLITTEQNLTQEQYDRFIESWMARFQGVANAHKPGVLEGKGVDAKLLSSSLKDMDLTAQERSDRDQILGMFGVPKVLLGISETGDSRSDAEGAEYVFAKYTIAPRMRFIATTLSEFYLPMWGLSPTRFRLWPVDAVPRNAEVDLKAKQASLAGLPWKKIDEIRAEEGLKPLPNGEGDKLYVPSTFKTADQVINPPDPVLPGAGGAAPTDNKPPKKALTKAPASDLVAGRITFVTSEIRKYTGKYKTILTKQGRKVVTTLNGKAVTEALTKDINENELTDELVRLVFSDWDDWIGLLVNPTRQALAASIAEAGKQALAELDLEQSFDQRDPRVVSWLETNAMQHATSVADTIKEEIKDRIIAGVNDGQGAEDIAVSIGEFFDSQSQWRALRIARSEVISGYAEGSLEGYRQSDVVQRKQWLTAGDDRVEPDCLMNEAQGAIALELPFASGHLAPIVHPNCRCVLRPVTD